jgi:hypothetical protein
MQGVSFHANLPFAVSVQTLREFVKCKDNVRSCAYLVKSFKFLSTTVDDHLVDYINTGNLAAALTYSSIFMQTGA